MNVIKGKLIIVVPVGDGFKRYVVCAIPRLNLSQLKIFALSRKVHLWQINPRIVKEFITSHGFECKIQTYKRSVFPFPFLAIFMVKLEYEMVALRMNHISMYI